MTQVLCLAGRMGSLRGCIFLAGRIDFLEQLLCLAGMMASL